MPIHVLKKVFLMMKLTFLLTVVLQVSTWATGFSQENRVSLQMKDVSLETIILELREQTGIRFFYSIDKIKAIDHLSIDVKNEVLKDVLSRLVEGTGLTYTLLDDVIVIKDLVVNQDPVRIFIRLKGWVVEKAGDAGGYGKIIGYFSRDGHGCEGVVFVAITRSRG